MPCGLKISLSWIFPLLNAWISTRICLLPFWGLVRGNWESESKRTSSCLIREELGRGGWTSYYLDREQRLMFQTGFSLGLVCLYRTGHRWDRHEVENPSIFSLIWYRSCLLFCDRAQLLFLTSGPTYLCWLFKYNNAGKEISYVYIHMLWIISGYRKRAPIWLLLIEFTLRIRRNWLLLRLACSSMKGDHLLACWPAWISSTANRENMLWDAHYLRQI